MTDNTPKIEKGIPIPPKGSGRPESSIVRKMEVGDSIFFNAQGGLRSARSIATRSGLKVTVRKVESGWRLWRIE